MRIDIASAESGHVPRAYPPETPAVPRPSRRIDGFELAVLVAFAGLSLWVLGLDLWQVIAHGQVWTGTDGFYVVDQMQYLAWIKDASSHGLASNLFVLRPTPADYFQPAVMISGGLAALGVAPWLALLIWKPVGVLATFLSVRGYTQRSITGRWPRRAGLVLGLFFGGFTIIYGSFGVLGDVYLGFLSWGYTFGLIAFALMLFSLLSYEKALTGGRLAILPGVLGALASSMHPWQGELLIVIVVLTEAARWLRTRVAPPRRHVYVAALTVALTALPLLYYAALGHLDPSWQLARGASKHSFSIWTVMLAIAPLALPAALAYRRPSRSFLDLATRVWPAGALLVFLLSGTGISATPLHAFEGVTVPLAVLAVQGLQGLSLRRWAQAPRARLGALSRALLHPRFLTPGRLLAGVGVALATIPGTFYELSSSRALVAPSEGNSNFIKPDERDALRYLAHAPERGGVITRFYLGTLVPAQTGRRTIVGNCLWSQPGCTARAQGTQRLLDGSLQAAAARRYVLDSGARFVLADCGSHQDLRTTLGPVVQSVHRFGCATVYTVA